MRLAFAGGGTGGHVVPGLHVLEHLVEAPDVVLEDLVWFGAGRAVESRVLAGLDALVSGATVERVVLALEPAGGGAPGPGGLALRLAPAIARARSALRRHRSEVLLGLGGFTMLPAVLAARSLRIPVHLIEINAVAGKATRWLSRFARRVHHAWPTTLPDGSRAGSRHVHVGPPLSPSLLAARAEGGGAARASLGFERDAPLLVVLGGSQGALGINRFLSEHVAVLTRAGVQVLHQVGPGRLEEAATSQAGYRATEYLDDVPRDLAAATLVLCRGGASTLAEVGALRVPAWVVPYPHHADRHQERNAGLLGTGVRIVDEEALSAERARELAELVGEAGSEQRAAMARALEACLPLDASVRIVADLLRA